MPSTDRRRRRQRGSSLVEALVASALLGIGVLTGLTAWDTATMSANKGLHQSWANCIVRSELDAILAAPFADRYPTPFSDGTVRVLVAGARGVPGAVGEEQLVTVQAFDPETGAKIFETSTLKARALTGGKDMGVQVLSDVELGCPAR